MADTTRTTSGSPSDGMVTPVKADELATGAPDRGPAKNGAAGGSNDAASVVTEAIGDVKKAGSELIGAARDSALSLLDNQKSRAADQIEAVGEAVRRSALSFEPVGGDAVVRYADQAAQQICGFAKSVRTRSWGDLAGEVDDFARRWPMVYVASAAGIGFLAGRFLLSSAERAAPAGSSAGAGSTALPSAAKSGHGATATRE